jgi:hypothetical protein
MNSQPNKWALLIGINQYPKLARRYQLSGCANDVEAMASILRDNYGFPDNHLAALKDGQATREGILAAMDALVGQVAEDDIVVIHYSGHGSQMTDREQDEADGRDETIVPSDSGRGSQPNRDITDDEIYLRLLPLARTTPYVTLIFDCCHSGTITRDAFGPSSRWVEPDLRPAEELPPSPIPVERAAGLREAARDLGPSGWLPIAERYVLIAGCRDEESSYEHIVASAHGGRPVTHGALTYFLAQELVSAGAGATYRDVFERASARVTAAHPRQHPQAEGARDRTLFGVHDIEPMRFVPVTGRADDQVTLAAGAAHGLTAGSRWMVYPQATKQVRDETPSLGQVEIVSIRAVSADARILEEASPGAIVVGSRAVEEAHNYGEMRLVVDLYPAPTGYGTATEALKQEIEQSRLLRLQADDEAEEAADMRAYVIAPRSEASENDPVAQLGAVQQATWAVVASGELAMPTHSVTEPGVVAVLRDNLEKLARYRNALTLQNPNPSSPLRGKVNLRLKRPAPDGEWMTVGEDEQAVFDVDDVIAFEITNRHSAPVYVTLLDFGLTGGISLLFPPNRPSEKLEPGITMIYGQRPGEGIELWIPDEFPLSHGTETFKLFATTHEVDFSWLQQERVRDVDRGFDTPLGRLFDMAYTGRGTRDARPTRLPEAEEWTTVERSFTLRRAASAAASEGGKAIPGLITDPVIAELEKSMRPGYLSGGGFLGPDESLDAVLASDTRALEQLGLPYDEVADALAEILQKALDQWPAKGSSQIPNLTRPWSVPHFSLQNLPSLEEGYLVDNKFQVFLLAWRGLQECPWGCAADRWAFFDFLLLNRETGEYITGPGMIVHLIREHQFFEGRESPYRVDPTQLVRVLQLEA